MFIHNINPTLIDLGITEIRYYGLVYALGFLITYWFMKKRIGQRKAENLIFYLVIGMLIGARLFEAIFWEPAYYFSNPLRILYFWEGGMAFHGGLIGILVAGYLFCRRYKERFFEIADMASLPAILFLALGRIANFINAELVGRITDVSWCVKFPGHEGCRHPSQIYEAIKRFIVFGWLVWLNRGRWKAGFIFWNFILWDNIGRVITDVWRADPDIFLGMNMGQLQSLIFAMIAAVFIYLLHREDIAKLFNLNNKV